MTDIAIPEAAVGAAVQAWHESPVDVLLDDLARDVLQAAAPLFIAAELERLAGEFEGQRDHCRATSEKALAPTTKERDWWRGQGFARSALLLRQRIAELKGGTDV